MKRYVLVALSSLLGLAVVVGAGATASSFVSKSVNFVSGCRFSHRNMDDPIVFPGQPGKSHDHTFIGSDSTNAFSTLGSLQESQSSCRRAGDTAAYWVPTLLSASGDPIQPLSASVYYRRHTLAPVRAFPPGFKQIAGNSKATAPQGMAITYWNCGPVAQMRPSATVPTCPNAGRRGLALHVRFPDCWDGINLDSPDHELHMAYSTRGRCPADHPVALPAIQLNLRYPTAGGAGVSLSSGGQFSAHADFFNAWNQGVLQSLVDGCLNALRHCQQGV
jgi:hypothetical protein